MPHTNRKVFRRAAGLYRRAGRIYSLAARPYIRRAETKNTSTAKPQRGTHSSQTSGKATIKNSSGKEK